MHETPDQEIDRYLRSGSVEMHYSAWPGEGFFDRVRYGEKALRAALIEAVRSRRPRGRRGMVPSERSCAAFVRTKVTPMVQGLFPAHEQALVLDVLCGSIVFVTPRTIEGVLERVSSLNTAWKLANLYLASIDAERLADDAPRIVGLSEETTCYVSGQYFNAAGRFDDYLVHEAAHVFHNCKRERIGLRPTRTKEWLLEIDYPKRETFAYACETYGRIVERGSGLRARQQLLADYARGPMPADDRVETEEYLDILGEAISARNGWKRILVRCAPPRPIRPRTTGQGAGDRVSGPHAGLPCGFLDDRRV